MCLYPNHSDIKVAKTDIKVYKVLIKRTSKITAPYMGFIYKLGETYTVKTKLGGNKTKRTINKGLHACTKLDRARQIQNFGNNRFIYRAIVPKGAIYKVSDNGEIASNMLKILRKN